MGLLLNLWPQYANMWVYDGEQHRDAEYARDTPMTATTSLPTTREALAAAIKADPTDLTLQGALADHITETTGDYDAAVAEVELLSLTAVVDADTRKGARIRTAIRAARGVAHITATRIEIVAGDAAPDYYGRTWHYETKTGVVIRHPNAYKRVAKSAELVYCPAFHSITVGADWVRENVL